MLVGFDFPIGLPLTYAKQVGVTRFLDLLPQLGTREWQDFFEPAALPDQINLFRPFYPAKPGSARRAHLEKALNLDFDNLFRQCEVKSDSRRAACPLFWTLGGQQVGKAAITGWQQVLIPGLKDRTLGLRLWPFHGRLSELVKSGSIVALETYPGEFYHQLDLVFPRQPGLRSGKRSQASRAANAPRLHEWADRARVHLEPELEAEIQDGFGNRPDGEDRFDALIGLFGLLNLILGLRPLEEPQEEGLRGIEGWIFGQALKPSQGEKEKKTFTR